MLSEVENALYIVATPIGNLGDISARALAVLTHVDIIAAEDTRHSQRLLKHYEINTKLIALHDFNEKERTETLIKHLQAGQSVALISDAGTPLISDPGYRLVTRVGEQGLRVVPIPGACAVISALSAAGLPTDKFVFEGFLPAKQQSRQHALEALQRETRTLVFYEAPHRIIACINDMAEIFGEQRQAVIARELTKKFETIRRGSLVELATWLASDSDQQRGEFVVLVHGAVISGELSVAVREVVDVLAEALPAKQAASLGAKITGVKKNQLYQYIIGEKI